MSETPNLGIGLVAAGQAQKHVTVNEALMRLDSVVNLSLRDRGRTAPPENATDGDRHLVGASATGPWAGRDGRIAMMSGGGWTFLPPSIGWLAWIEDEELHRVFDGEEWIPFRAGLDRVPQLGIGTDADEVNRFAARLNNALWTAQEAAAGGTGDLRYVMNKETTGNVLSLLMQTGWSGRAEIGLVGSDDLAIRTSPDGGAWHDALRMHVATGAVEAPAGIVTASLNDGPLGGCRNMLINGAFTVNQRGFVGGALADGAYGYDRWRAVGAQVSVSQQAGVVTLAGAIEQVIEAPGIGGRMVTVSLEDPSAGITIEIAGVSDTIMPGQGRRGATLILPGEATGDVVVRLMAPQETNFARVQMEIGSYATPFEYRHAGAELNLCRRYYCELGGMLAQEEVAQAVCISATVAHALVNLPAPMRVPPAFAFTGPWLLAHSNNINVTGITLAGDHSERAMLRLTVASGMNAGQARRLVANNTEARLRFDAEF